MKSEGRHEVEAARKRLVAAQSQGTSAFKAMEVAEQIMNDANATMETAKRMLELARKSMVTAKTNKSAAQAQVDSSKREIEEAEKSLKEAETRWEVVEISDEPEELPSRKKRKPSRDSAPRGIDENNDDTARESEASSSATLLAIAANHSSTSSIGQWAAHYCESRNGRIASSYQGSMPSNSTNVQKIVVEGCGMPEVNGIYTFIDQFCEGKPMYCKIGQQIDGAPSDYGICFYGERWYIISGESDFLYKTTQVGGSVHHFLPPENPKDWCLDDEGKFPLPRVKWQ